MSPDVEALWKEFEITNGNIMKIKEAVETLLQPNPNLRMEKFVLSKIDTGNQLGRPQDQSPYENLGKTLSAASKPIASSNPMVILEKRQLTLHACEHITDDVCGHFTLAMSV